MLDYIRVTYLVCMSVYETDHLCGIPMAMGALHHNELGGMYDTHPTKVKV